MRTISARNVNDAYPLGIMLLRSYGIEQPSRNGPVIECDQPVSISYRRPMERVLFNKQRDVNPFLHFFEPLWILAGCQDVAFLSNIVSRFKEYSDNGDVFYGAYGHRLRYPEDQIEKAICLLKENPDDRRVVLQIRKPDDMWYSGKDQPCNTAIACKIRDGALNIHVFNRSNDYFWGMLGANMPQFSTLQEYMAGHIGCRVGTYHQTTDSMHVYTELNNLWDKVKDGQAGVFIVDPYEQLRPYPMIGAGVNPKDFDADLHNFFYEGQRSYFLTPYFNNVVVPIWRTFVAHKNDKTGGKYVFDIAADDWRAYTIQWIERRTVKEQA